MTQATRLPPPPPPPTSPSSSTIQGTVWSKSAGRRVTARRTGIYGPGGIGKSTLASLALFPRFIDLERGTNALDVQRIEPPNGQPWTWALLRQAVQTESLWSSGKVPCQTLVLDTATAAEELDVQHVVGSVPLYDKGGQATSIESYGFGKGYVHVYEEFLKLLGDLDAHVRAGRNVVLLMHDCVARVPNPESEDFQRYEPRLQSPPAGKNSIRHRVKEWCDELLFLGYDLSVTKGKARGQGTRTIYCQELPWYMAKSRTLADPIPFQNASDDTLWQTLFPPIQGD